MIHIHIYIYNPSSVAILAQENVVLEGTLLNRISSSLYTCILILCTLPPPSSLLWLALSAMAMFATSA